MDIEQPKVFHGVLVPCANKTLESPSSLSPAHDRGRTKLLGRLRNYRLSGQSDTGYASSVLKQAAP